MPDFRYKFTVFTPCYNSEKFIFRVFDSLMNQTFKNYEWLVINDCSTDNTAQIIEEYISKADFDIQFFNLTKNQMLTKNYNLAIKNANGEFFMPLGHDDALRSNALQTFLNYWEKIPEADKNHFSGVSCTCIDQNGKLIGDLYPESPYFSDFFQTVYDLKIKGEKQGFMKTEIMREFPLPELDVFIPEGLVRHFIGEKYKTLYINDSLRIYYINQSHESLCSTASKTIKYPKGICFYSLCLLNRYFKRVDKKYFLKIKTILKYCRMSVHLKIKLKNSAEEIKSPVYKFAFLMLYPVIILITIRDRILRYI